MSLNILRAILIVSPLILFSSCTSEQETPAPESTAEQVELPSNRLEITNVWARPGRVDGVSAIYMNILNGFSESDTLISLSSPITDMVEVHETYEEEDGMMGMRSAGTIVAPAKSTLLLEPGGLHVMLMQLNRELTEGDSLELTVEFAKAGEITMIVPVQPMNR